MKDRIFVVLSWVAFAHALIVLAGVLDGMNNSLPIPTSEVSRFYRDYLSTVFAGGDRQGVIHPVQRASQHNQRMSECGP